VDRSDRLSDDERETLRATPALQRLLPADAVAGTDECDAAICAMLALAFALDGESELLPQLVSPDASVSVEQLRSEGWIYYPSPA
jgi:hypothetical protein